MAKAADRDARAKIKVSGAVRGLEPAPFAARERHIGARIGRQDRRRRLGGGRHLISHGTLALDSLKTKRRPRGRRRLRYLGFHYVECMKSQAHGQIQAMLEDHGPAGRPRSRFDSENRRHGAIGLGKTECEGPGRLDLNQRLV